MRFHNARNVHNMHTQAIFKTSCMQLCNTTTPHMNDTEFINEREDEVYDRSKRFMSLVKNQDFESMTNETIPNVFETSCNSDTLSVMLQEKRDGVSCIVTVSILTSPSLLDEENTPDFTKTCRPWTRWSTLSSIQMTRSKLGRNLGHLRKVGFCNSSLATKSSTNNCYKITKTFVRVMKRCLTR